MNKRRAIVIPILLIVLGTGWLLTVRGFMPGVNWVWIAGLGVTGLLVMLVAGFDKITLVVGPFLIVCSVMSILRQSGKLDVETEIPVLTILFGALMLGVQLLPVPNPKWMNDAVLKDDKPKQP